MKPTVLGAGIIVFNQTNGDRHYLLLRSKGGAWGFAKGKLNPLELTEDAAHRELQEETGLTAKIVPNFTSSMHYRFTERDGTKTRKKVTFFVGETNSLEVTLSDEHSDFIWLPYESAVQKSTYANTKSILKSAELFLNNTIDKK